MCISMRPCVPATVFLLAVQFAVASLAQEADFTTIRVRDAETGRGVPLVTLTTVNKRSYVTDSNGVIAFHEPGLMNKQVYFHIQSHGYEYPKDGFGYRGAKIQTTPGVTVNLQIHRVNVAQRLYRITGQGIYRDSKRVGIPSPIQDQVPGNVLGSDSVLCESIGDYFYWFWGDTNRIKYPLGNFHVTGARSRRFQRGGLDPDRGIELEYFTRKDGFAREMARMPGDGLTWLDCLMKTDEEDGTPRLFAVYLKVRAPLNVYQRGIAEFRFDQLAWVHRMTFPPTQRVIPQGHPLRYRNKQDATDYFYFAGGLPRVRVPANAGALLSANAYEAYTPLSETAEKKYQVLRDANGELAYRWTAKAPAMTADIASRLVAEKELTKHETGNDLVDIETGKLVRTQHGSVYYNQQKQRYVMIVSQVGGSSFLGEIWYAEAPEPLGPWKYARKIVTHDKYSFYNPKQHPLLGGDQGKTIYFEGTYTQMFSGNEHPTPGYDYNQMMYKLDIADPRLNLPLPVKRKGSDGSPQQVPAQLTAADFYALPQQGEGTLEVTCDGEKIWIAENPGPNRIALYEFTNANGDQVKRVEGVVVPGYTRQRRLGYVWKK